MSDEVVVTGVAGFIGSHLAEKLLDNGYEVTGIDNFHSYYAEDIKRENLAEVKESAEESSGHFNFIEGSILESSDLDRLPSRPELVFHLAAVAGTRSSIKNPSEYIKVNVQGTSELIESFESIGKLVFTSSSSIYGEVSAQNLPVEEASDLSPETPYALSKISAEKTIKLYSDIYSFEYAILRPFTVYGPRQRPTQAVTKFIRKIMNGEPVTVYGDGSQTRDFTYIDDAIKGIFKAGKTGEGVYNISGGKRITVNRLIDFIEENIDEPVERKYIERQAGDVSHTHADTSKAEKKIEYSPEVDLEQGIKKSIEWFKNSICTGKSSIKLKQFE